MPKELQPSGTEQNRQGALEQNVVLQQNMILLDTGLCAIFRDEMLNPTGKNPGDAIRDYFASTVPYVETADITDTGSIDGTRELLEELAGKYKNVIIHDYKFDGFASSRNCSIKKPKTRWALVLDADERLTRDDFTKLKRIQEVHQDKYGGFSFKFLSVESTKERSIAGHNPRLFELSEEIEYRTNEGELYEYLCKDGWWAWRHSDTILKTGITIKHFESSDTSRKVKTKEWYALLQQNLFHGKVVGFDLSPSEITSCMQWKAYNPRREEYR